MPNRKFILSDTILLLILLYPFIFILKFVIKIDYSITVPYFMFINTLVFIDLIIKKVSRLHIWKISLPYLLLIFIILINTKNIRNTMPLVFILSLYITDVYTYNCKSCLRKEKIISYFIILFILTSVLFLMLEIGYSQDDRFTSFLLSATTFSAYLILVFLISTLLFSQKRIILLIYFLSIGLIWYSGTRLNLIFLVLLPLIYYILKYKIVSKKILYSSFVGVLLFIYPAYQLTIKFFPFLISRYSDGIDTSYNLRINLFYEVSDNYISGSLFQKIFGKGAEFSREFIKGIHGIDLFPHNDFIRFLNDFGAIALLLLFYILYKLSKRGGIPVFIAILLYYVMFYSNMIYNLFYMYMFFIIVSLSQPVTKKTTEL